MPTDNPRRDSADKQLRDKRGGMMRAFAHAIDMNKDGKLEDNELEEFRKLLLGATLDDFSMEEYEFASKSGDLDKLRGMAGFDNENESSRGGQMRREGIAQKVAADFITKLYEAGHVDAETYARQMEDLGQLPEAFRQKREKAGVLGREGPSTEDAADAAWENFTGKGAEGGLTVQVTPDAEDEFLERNPMDAYAPEWHKRQSNIRKT